MPNALPTVANTKECSQKLVANSTECSRKRQLGNSKEYSRINIIPAYLGLLIKYADLLSTVPLFDA